MQNLIALALLAVLFSSCDPVAHMEATIENSTDQDLSIVFSSFDASSLPSDTLQIESGETIVFQDVFDVGNTFLEPYMEDYDSVVIKNLANEILKVYKPNDTGKNIYNIEDFWISREPSKRVFEYEYEIEQGDIE